MHVCMHAWGFTSHLRLLHYNQNMQWDEMRLMHEITAKGGSEMKYAGFYTLFSSIPVI